MPVNTKGPGWDSEGRDESSFAPVSTYDNRCTNVYLVLSCKGVASYSVQGDSTKLGTKARRSLRLWEQVNKGCGSGNRHLASQNHVQM